MSRFSVTLLTTEKCNLRCAYCYEKFEYKASNADEMEKIRGFFSTLSHKYTDIQVSFFGGEPLLALRQMRAVIQFNAGLQSNFTYSLTTNGTLLSPQLLQELVNSNLVHLQVTLDGLGASHNEIRQTKNGLATFDRIYNNLLGYREVQGKFIGLVRVNAAPSNAQDVAKLAQNIARDFGRDERFRVFIRPVGKWGGQKDEDLAVLDAISYDILEREFYSHIPDHMKWNADSEVCYAAMPNHLLLYPDGRLGKCTVGLHDDINDIGRVLNDGSISIDAKKFSFWSRGIRNGNKEQKACPYWASE